MTAANNGSKITTKLLIGVGLFLFVFVVFQIVVMGSLSMLEKHTSQLFEKNNSIELSLGDAIVSLSEMSSNVIKSVSENNAEDTSFEDQAKALKGQLAEIKKETDKTIISDKYKQGIDKAMLLIEDIEKITSSNHPDFKQLASSLDELNGELVKLTFVDSNVIVELATTVGKKISSVATNIIIWMTLLFVAVGVFYVFFVVKSIRTAIAQTLKFSELIAKGDLTQNCQYYKDDEIGQINKSLEELKNRLKAVILSADDISKKLLSASSEFLEDSSKISEGANTQATSADDIMKAMSSISNTLTNTSNNATETDQIAHSTYNDLLQGVSKVGETMTIIETIAKKNSVIKEIAYQTKILSLNASVEAARAQEYGKGFAVVADEVKKLAEGSQESSDEIIKVSKMGVESGRQSVDLLNAIVPDIKKTTELISQIAHSESEQIDSIRQVYTSIQNLDLVTKQNASSSENLSSSAEELVKMSKSIGELISYFKIKEDSNNEDLFESASYANLHNNAEISFIEKSDYTTKDNLKDNAFEKIPSSVVSDNATKSITNSLTNTHVNKPANKSVENTDTKEHIDKIEKTKDIQPIVEKEEKTSPINALSTELPEDNELKSKQKIESSILFDSELEKKVANKTIDKLKKAVSKKTEKTVGVEKLLIEKTARKSQAANTATAKKVTTPDSKPSIQSIKSSNMGVHINLSDNDDLDKEFEKMR